MRFDPNVFSLVVILVSLDVMIALIIAVLPRTIPDPKDLETPSTFSTVAGTIAGWGCFVPLMLIRLFVAALAAVTVKLDKIRHQIRRALTVKSGAYHREIGTL